MRMSSVVVCGFSLGVCPTLAVRDEAKEIGQMRGHGLEKPEEYSLESIEDFFESRATQMVVDRST